MKFFIARDKFYLLVVCFSMSLLFFNTVAGQQELSLLLPFIMLLIVGYDPLLNVIQQITGNRSKGDELSFFSALIELNKKIQNYHEIDKVILAVDNTLKETFKVRKSIFLVNAEFYSTSTKWTNSNRDEVCLKVWPEQDEEYSFLDEDFECQLKRVKDIYYYTDANPVLIRAFNETETNLAIPIMQDNKLLCLILAAGPRKEHRYKKAVNDMLSFMVNQLSVVLDRILMYEKLKYKTAMDHAEKMQVMQSLSTSIAHEMRTPLSGIRASISGVESYLPELLAAHDYSVNTDKDNFNRIRDDHLAVIKGTPNRITLMIDQANAVIDMLLINLRENSLDRRQLNICSAKESIEQAIDRYPFKTGERKKVILDLSEDFNFLGIESLFVYIIFNLMKNSLYSLCSNQKGVITICLEKRVENNYIIFKDTGEGIKEKDLLRIFEGFFTTKSDGTGVGLAYCKRTIESFGGQIRCRSELGYYTEFKMTLPALSQT